MATLPDKAFDLAIVDPPYGLGEGGNNILRHHSQAKYKASDWDKYPPPIKYFKELMRVSKNQIIWGANHFISRIPFDSPAWIYWHKDRYNDFADGELAWTSFKTAVRAYKFTWDGFRKQLPQERIHPTEKPIQLYRWLLEKYAKQGNKILDTHLGSGSSAIAAHYGGFDFVGCELDKDYYNAACKRFKEQTKQLTLI
jgi:site-specific DNA-methyltransferase (adenine-specific)